MRNDCSLLLVEDQPENVEILREAMRLSAVPCEIAVARNGKAALRNLNQFRSTENARLPDLVLLDLDLPDISGQEILRALKNDPNLKSIPVIVLSDSSSRHEIESAYRRHANAYVVKPERLDGFVRFASSLAAFWLSTAALPKTV